MFGIRMRAVASSHPCHGDRERRVKEDGEVPELHQLVTVQEQPVDDEYRARRGGPPRKVQDRRNHVSDVVKQLPPHEAHVVPPFMTAKAQHAPPIEEVILADASPAAVRIKPVGTGQLACLGLTPSPVVRQHNCHYDACTFRTFRPR